ncbi:MAG: ABC transporter ATP-binding protein [Bacteroidetes bacterium]|nr:ABC transporter ATP-binding protein [Bacteroidota bacterium]
MINIAVSIQNLEFIYPDQTDACLHGIYLEVCTGQRFGLFGPNGAGKTTLINCMTGLLNYQRGSIKLFGNEVKNNRNEVNKLFGFVPQEFSFYQELSPIENLAFFGALYGMNKAAIRAKTEELIDVFGFSDVSNKPVHKFSGGMKRRLNLAIGVLNTPQILFLDEPTVGVDIHSRQAIISYLKQLNQKGTTLIYTSHQLNEAEDLCDKIALIVDGKILVNDSLPNLLGIYNEKGLEGLFIKLTGKMYRDI